MAGYDLVETTSSEASIPGVALAAHAIAIRYGDAANVEIAGRRVALAEISLRGLVPTPWSLTGVDRLNFFFVRLLPPSLYHLIRGSVAELSGHVVDVGAFSIKAMPVGIADALASAGPNIEAKVTIVERFLRRLFTGLRRDAPPVVRSSTRGLDLDRLADDDPPYSQPAADPA